MGVEENKKAQRRIVEEVFNNKDLSVIPELISPGFEYEEFFGSLKDLKDSNKCVKCRMQLFLTYTIRLKT